MAINIGLFLEAKNTKMVHHFLEANTKGDRNDLVTRLHEWFEHPKGITFLGENNNT